MNITVNSTTLVQELRLINQVAAVKPPLPILMNVLLRADDHLHLFASDLEVGFSTGCQAQIDEPGVITLPAKRLLDLVEQLPDTDVQIVTDAKHVHILSGQFRSRLQTLPPDDFPQAPEVAGEPTSFSTAALQQMIKRVRYAITDNGSNFVIKGALLSVADNVCGLVATDGKRLSLATMSQAGAATSVLLPTKALDMLMGLFAGGEMVFSQDERHLFFSVGHRMLFSRMLAGKFPAYQSIIPRNNDRRATVGRAALASAVRRVAMVAPENQSMVFDLDADMLSVSSSSQEVGDAQETVAADYAGEPMRVTLSGQYLLDFLEVAEGQQVVLDLKDARSPLLVTDGSSFLNVIMSMRS